MKTSLQKAISFGLFIVSVALAVLIVCQIQNTHRIECLEETNQQLTEQLRPSNNHPNTQIMESEQANGVDEDKPTRPIEVFSWDIKDMKRAGLKDPLKDIISDLKRHRELIPYEGSMGGTMNFVGSSKMWILTKKWVLAYFEDGHNGGYLLLEFEITKDGKINWKRLASYLS
jgi:hypothetical protein